MRIQIFGAIPISTAAAPCAVVPAVLAEAPGEEQTIQLIADLIISYNLTMFVDRYL